MARRVLVILVAAACGEPYVAPTPRIDRVEPASGPEGVAVPIRVAGAGFRLEVIRDLGRARPRSEPSPGRWAIARSKT